MGTCTCVWKRGTFGLQIHADDDVEAIFYLGHKIHHGQAIPFQIARKGRRLRHVHTLFIKGFYQAR